MSYKPWKTSEDLIESVKRKIAFPLSQNTFDEEDILHFANEEMMLSMVPQILSFNEEFFVYKEKYPLVMGKFNYPIPPRAIGMKLKDIFYEDSVGNVFEMTRIDPANKDYYQNDTANQNNYKYYYENNDIVLAKTSVTPIIGYMRVEYFLRPNQLVLLDRAATIVDLIRENDTDVYLKFDAIPEHIIANSKVDFLQTESGHKLFTKDVIMPAIETIGTHIGYFKFTTTDIPADVSIGDYMCTQYECIIPQAPDDLHSGLAERVCSRILASLGDKEGLKASNEKVKDIEYRQGNLIDNRTEAQCQKIVGRHTILRYNKARYRRY